MEEYLDADCAEPVPVAELAQGVEVAGGHEGEQGEQVAWSSPACSAADCTWVSETKSILLSTATPTCAAISTLIR
jgi:hypothetical protein